MSTKIKLICVFCLKKNEPLHSFTPSFLEKCKTILDIRKNNNLSMRDAKVPVDVNDIQKYHSKCYKLFTALPKKYRSSGGSEPSSHESSLQEDTKSNDQHIAVVDINAPDEAKDINFGVSTSRQLDANEGIILDNLSNTGEKSLVSNDSVREKFIESTTDETADLVDTDGKDIACIFCNKKRKKMHGNEQVLQTCVIPEKIDILKSVASEMNDIDLLNRIDEKSAKNALIYYHRCCKLHYNNKLQSILKSSSTEQTSWHVSRSLHSKAFEAVYSYISTHVINRNRCVYLSFLKSLFEEFTKNYTTESRNFEPYNLENRLLEKFPKKINIITVDRQKIVKPYRGNLLKNDLDMLREQDILDRAAQILRSEIQSIQHNPLPNEPTTSDLIKGECDVPPILTDFFSKIICSSLRRKRNMNVNRISTSFAEDLIYATSRGKIKPSKHISLGIALKGLTNSKKIINILNKFGHCCSYTVLEEIETEATFASTNRNDVCPEGIVRSNKLCTGLAYDNFDRFIDTTSGKDTLHNTVGIIFQNVSNTNDESESAAESSHMENSVFEYNNGSDQPQSAGSKRRRRTFDAVTFELEAYNKKMKKFMWINTQKIYTFFAENVESDVIETSDNIEEDDLEKLENERNLIIDSSDDSCEESDGYDTDTAEDVYE